jgi:hypothetical protein
MSPFEITWEAPEFDYRPKDVSWYWISIIVAIVILGLAIWQRNFLFGFFIVIAEIMVLIWGSREPEMVKFKLTEKGIFVGEVKFHAYEEIARFSLYDGYDENWPNLYLEFRSRLRPTLKIKLPKNRLAEIQKTLKLFLPQTEHQPSLLEALEELTKF